MNLKGTARKIRIGIDKKLFLRPKNREYVARPALLKIEPKRSNDQQGILLVAVAFNRPKLIELQYKFLEKNLRDPFSYWVADNSDSEECAKEIAEYARSQGVGYVRLPENPYSGLDGSLSHGFALNWIYENLIKPNSPAYFGFLDHDIFPIVPTRLIPQIEANHAFGLLADKKNLQGGWYLWAGFQFFSFTWAKGRGFNFLPVAGFDTAGANYKIFQGVDKTKMIQSTTDIEIPDSSPPRNIQKIGMDWIHIAESYLDDYYAVKIKYISHILKS